MRATSEQRNRVRGRRAGIEGIGREQREGVDLKEASGKEIQLQEAGGEAESESGRCAGEPGALAEVKQDEGLEERRNVLLDERG